MNQGGPPSRKTMAYSFVDPTARKTAVAPTESMEAVTMTQIKEVHHKPDVIPGNVARLISLLIEKDVEAWRALPTLVKDFLMSQDSWKFLPNEKTGVPNLLLNSVELRWNGTEWVLEDLHR
jgi:hypothetical protein